MMDDDGLVLNDGVLRSPLYIRTAAGQHFFKRDGRSPKAQIRRYSDNYPIPDKTTPTFQQWRALGGGR